MVSLSTLTVAANRVSIRAYLPATKSSPRLHLYLRTLSVSLSLRWSSGAKALGAK